LMRELSALLKLQCRKLAVKLRKRVPE